MAEKRVIIVGGGFGGVTLAQHLERSVNSEIEIVLISRENHFVFTPMLAEVVGRSISPLHIVVPGRQMVQRATWLTARVTEIELKNNHVHYMATGGEAGSFTYDHLVLSCGSVVNLDIMPGMAAHAHPLKTLGDAIFLGNDLIGHMEEAAVESDSIKRQRLLTVVVIGGGFSGVEVSGAIADLLDRIRCFYPQLKHERPRVILLHRGNRILQELNAPSLSEFAYSKLRERGIDVRLKTEAQEVSAIEVRLKSGEQIETATVVCTVGNTPNPLIRNLGLPINRGLIVTDPDMRVSGFVNVWALGDCAAVPNAHDGKPSPPTAQFVTRQAKHLADNLMYILKGQPTKAFSFKPLGMLASIGHKNGVGEILGFKLSGFLAWFFWRGVYLAKLPTLARKIEVAIDWAWQIFFPPNIVQLQMARTERAGRAHYAAGEFVLRKGDLGDRFFVIESGKAGIYLDENSPPIAVLKAGDYFGEGAILSPGGKGLRMASVKAETALDLITLVREDFMRLSESLGALQKDIHRSMLARSGYQRFMEMVKQEPHFALAKVSEVMSQPAHTLPLTLTLEEAVERFHGDKPGYPVVDENGILRGYCGRSELYEALSGIISIKTLVVDFMRKDSPAISENQSLVDATLVLMREQIEILPVVSSDGSGKVVGVLSPIDVFRQVLKLLRLQPG